MTIQPQRIRMLKEGDPRENGAYVLYWMQAAKRAHGNHALEYAIDRANELDLPLVCVFGMTDAFPDGNARHYHFMVEGLAEVEADLAKRHVTFHGALGDPDEIALRLSKKAALTVCDRGYLRIEKEWRRRLAKAIDCPLHQIETETVVPVETASPKHEYAARTLRPKIHRLWDEFLQPLSERRVKHKQAADVPKSKFDLSDPAKLVASMKLDHKIGAVTRFRGGQGEARKRLKAFLGKSFATYGTNRNRPEAAAASHMSPYLHFGQIGPLEIALAVREAKTGGDEDKTSYLEELIVRRELAINHVFYEEKYDDYACLPDWCRKTLGEHAEDKREHVYSESQLAAGETHDHYWNAAMREMRETGYMHNQLRMYWGKKILEWSASPEEAFARTLRLNNRYFLDGRDANSFTNVAWLFGLHDRPWGRRPVFGSIRYLGPATLKKFDADAYVATVDKLAKAETDR
ncbi:deoxyribodipyrimidine photo-lyase [Aureimonas sp. Leaf324]|jgi:deoxyribodipyrimidine photo-lyase|uniref:deoxyribodipyrimidine photo-lyase n=1 Tax=Aureimonas sp. Leaf324 TaxID=1736336 RepID=UPI0006FDBD47|nr:deoxyribodipyrimidine photo-lyase [Aureimonas sp. Leaf324]KQQ81909.1 deoxyribodipyrimidine photolyase [Aureimonas sp. Leaf324]